MRETGDTKKKLKILSTKSNFKIKEFQKIILFSLILRRDKCKLELQLYQQ